MKIIKAGVSMINTSGIDRKSIIAHIEKCGRVCYKSEGLITEESGEKFVGNIIKRGHTSVLEHGNLIFVAAKDTFNVLDTMTSLLRCAGYTTYLRFSSFNERRVVSGNVRAWRDFLSLWDACGYKVPESIIMNFREYGVLMGDVLEKLQATSVYCTPMISVSCNELTEKEQFIHCTQTVRFVVDRGISHELVRHRTLSPSQESTRYCNYSNAKFGGEITVIEPCYLAERTLPYYVWMDSCRNDENHYFSLLDIGLTPQEARGALPTSLKTEVIMTGTYAEWHKFLKLRTGQGVHPQMREVADSLLRTMQTCHPGWYGNIHAAA